MFIDNFDNPNKGYSFYPYKVTNFGIWRYEVAITLAKGPSDWALSQATFSRRRTNIQNTNQQTDTYGNSYFDKNV